jgi:hypothetical protein
MSLFFLSMFCMKGKRGAAWTTSMTLLFLLAQMFAKFQQLAELKDSYGAQKTESLDFVSFDSVSQVTHTWQDTVRHTTGSQKLRTNT